MKIPLAQSALHEIYRQQGARLEERGRWHVPAEFGSVDAEAAAARTAVAIGERPDRGVLDLEGEDLDGLADGLGVGEVTVGTAAPLSLAGDVEARWCRLTRSRARLLVADREQLDHPADPEAEPFVRREQTPLKPALERGFDSPIYGGLFPVDTAFRPWLARVADILITHLEGKDGSAADPAGSSPCLHLSDLSSGLTSLAVLGPRSPDLLARVVRIDVDPHAFAGRTLALTGAVGIPLQLLRWDCGSVLAYELTVGRDVAAYFWDILMHAGEDLDLQPIGVDALSRLQEPGLGP